MILSVKFIYDERATRWDVIVENAESDQDALDAVAAVVLTCKDERVTGSGMVLQTRADGSREIAMGIR